MADGNYVFYFNAEANGKVVAYKTIPNKYKSRNTENKVTVSGGAPLNIELK